VVPNLFVTADRPVLDNYTAAQKYYRNSVSMRRIDQSHAQKASGVTTSIHFAISPPGLEDHCPKHATHYCLTLFRYPHIGKKKRLKRIPNRLKVEWLLLH